MMIFEYFDLTLREGNLLEELVAFRIESCHVKDHKQREWLQNLNDE